MRWWSIIRSALMVESSRRFDRYTTAWISALPSCRSSASRLRHCAGRGCERHEKMEEFNRSYGHKLVWLPWQRPGFELGMMLKRAVEQQPGQRWSHSGWTWSLYLGRNTTGCYLNTITIIDQLTSFIEEHLEKRGGTVFGGTQRETLRIAKQWRLKLCHICEAEWRRRSG